MKVDCCTFNSKRLLLLNLILFLAGIITICSTSFILDIFKRKILVLEEGNLVYKHWQISQEPIITKVFFFNWTNPEDFHNKSVKLKFEETEPYILSVRTERLNIRWNDNGTLTYQERFVPHEVDDALDRMNITSLDLLHVLITYRLRLWSVWAKLGIKMTIKYFSTKLYKTYKAREFLWGVDENYWSLLYILNKEIDIPSSKDWLGVFSGRNYTTHFVGDVNIGRNYENLGKIYRWFHNDSVPYYEGECRKINGSLGYINPPDLLARKERITLFYPDFCGDFVLDYAGEEYVESMKGYKYEMHSFLDNGTLYPERECYKSGLSVPFGFHNSSNCQHNIPVFTSLPHFYKADPSHFEHVKGLKPDGDKHNFYLIIEPTFNLPLRLCARAQINWYIQPYSLTAYEDVRRMMFPILWVEQCFNIPDEVLTAIKIGINYPSVQYGMGSALIVISIIIYCWIKVKNYKARSSITLAKEEKEKEPLKLTK